MRISTRASLGVRYAQNVAIRIAKPSHLYFSAGRRPDSELVLLDVRKVHETHAFLESAFTVASTSATLEPSMVCPREISDERNAESDSTRFKNCRKVVFGHGLRAERVPIEGRSTCAVPGTNNALSAWPLRECPCQSSSYFNQILPKRTQPHRTLIIETFVGSSE
jgi:hypothetical protein